MRHQTIAGFAALMTLALIAASSVAIIARQRDGSGNAAGNIASAGIAGYTLAGTIGGPLIPTTPVDVAVDADGRIFVADIGLNRVLAFTPDGALDAAWGDNGMSERLIFPAGLALGPDGSLYVLQLGNTEVHVLDGDGNERDVWSVGGNQDLTGISVPTAIAVDGQGTVYIPDQGAQQIGRYSSGGEELDAWPFPLGAIDADGIRPQDIVEWDGRMLMSYQRASGDSGGLLIFEADGQGTPAPDGLVETPAFGAYAPGEIAAGPDGELAVMFLSDEEDAAPFIGTADGGWTPAGIPAITAVNGLVFPGIAWEPNGLLLVSDPARQRVRIFRANGAVAGDIQPPTGEGFLAGLDEIAVGPDGLLYTADPLLGRVTAFRPDGSVQTTFQLPDDPEEPLTTGFTRQRMRIAVDGAGAVYVVDEFTGQITKFNPDGEVIETDWAAQADPEQPVVAMMLAAGSDDRIYLVDFESQDQIRVFNSDGEDLGLLIEPFGDGAIQDIGVAGGTLYTVELGAGSSPVRSFSTGGDYLDELADLSRGGDNANRTGFALAAEPDGGLLIAAVNVASGPEFEYQLLRLEPDGDLHRLGTLDVPFTTLPDIAVDSVGALYLAAPNDQVIYVYEIEE